MAFVNRLNAVFVVAGGDTVPGPIQKNHQVRLFLEIYVLVLMSQIMMALIKCTVIQCVTRTLTMEMSYSGQKVAFISDVYKGHIIAMPAILANPDKDFEKSWKCLNVVEVLHSISLDYIESKAAFAIEN